jgi:hypothetical protein
MLQYCMYTLRHGQLFAVSARASRQISDTRHERRARSSQTVSWPANQSGRISRPCLSDHVATVDKSGDGVIVHERRVPKLRKTEAPAHSTRRWRLNRLIDEVSRIAAQVGEPAITCGVVNDVARTEVAAEGQHANKLIALR